MSLLRLLSIIKRVMIQMLRDRRTLVLIIVVPSFVMTIVAYLFGISTSTYPIGILNQDEGTLIPTGLMTPPQEIKMADKIIDGLKEDKDLKIVDVKEADIDKKLKDGDLKGVLIFDKDFSKKYMIDKKAPIELRLEGSDPSQNMAVKGKINSDIFKIFAKLPSPQATSSTKQNQQLPANVETKYIYGGEKFKTFDWTMPVLISIFVFFFAFLLTSLSFFRERSFGTIERMLVSPLTKLEIILGYMLGFVFFAMVQATIIILFALYAIKINYVGNIGWLFLIQCIFVLVAINLGIFLSAFARTEFQIVQFFPLVLIPQVLICGTVFPIQDMPKWLQYIAYCLPLTYVNRAARNVMIRGFGFEGIWLDLLIILGFAILMIILGSLTIRREIA